MTADYDDLLIETTVVDLSEVGRHGDSRSLPAVAEPAGTSGRYHLSTAGRRPLPLTPEGNGGEMSIAADPPPPGAVAEGSMKMQRIWTPADAGAREVSIRRGSPPSEADVRAITSFLARAQRGRRCR